MKALFAYLIFPGFLFCALIGLVSGWLDRKVSARIQWRVGPPWHQNFTDILKLLGKETIAPPGAAGAVFLLAPYLGLLSLVLAATILGRAFLAPTESFAGDLIVVLYLLTMPALAVIIGASSSRNVLASVGASREMKLVLAYELPFILAAVAVIIKSAGALRLGDIVSYQLHSGSHFASASGALAFIAAFFCVQAKLGLAPFDVSEAEQEIMAGALIEYSGLPLAVFRLTKAVLLYTLPVFLMALFLGGSITPVALAVKFLTLLVAVILIKNTNPRLRIDQAMGFFWGPVTLAALAAVILALFGR